jgi:hypothetical protein
MHFDYKNKNINPLHILENERLFNDLLFSDLIIAWTLGVEIFLSTQFIWSGHRLKLLISISDDVYFIFS